MATELAVVVHGELAASAVAQQVVTEEHRLALGELMAKLQELQEALSAESAKLVKAEA